MERSSVGEGQPVDFLHGADRSAVPTVVPRGADTKGFSESKGQEKNRVSLELSFVPPHPFLLNMPERLHTQAKSITQAYSKLVRLVDQHCMNLNSR